jgi:ribosome maturation factor RimP
MQFKREKKDLDSWIGKEIKVIINIHDDLFYTGILLEEQKNGILISYEGKKFYIPYETVVVIEEI